MKKTLLTAIAISALLALLVAGMHVVEMANANWVILPKSPNTDKPVLIVQSPINGNHYVDSVILNLTVIKPTSWNQSRYDPNVIAGISYIHYFVDGREASLPCDNLDTVSSFSKTFVGLSSGQHRLTVVVFSRSQYAPTTEPHFGTSVPPFYFYDAQVTETINFTIGVSPKIENLSLKDKTYNTNIVQLRFTVDKLTSWIGYSIDDTANVTLTGNTTLGGVPEGFHNLSLYANDTDGNMGKSETVAFTINTQPSPSPTLSPSDSPTQQTTLSTTPIPNLDDLPRGESERIRNSFLIQIGSAIIILIGIIVLVFFRTRKK